MEQIFGDIIFSLIGRIYLYIVYRDRERVKKVLAEKYDNKYGMAGAIVVWLAFAWVLLLVIVFGLTCILVGIIMALIV